MVSDRQLEANQTNAQKSTGPQTPEGRAAVRLNGVKHGLTARTIVLKDESLTEFDELLDDVQAEHQPATPTEEALVLQIAMAIWRLRRSYHTEGGFLTIRRIKTNDQFERFNHAQYGHHLGIVADDDARGPNTMSNLSCYEARLRSSMHKALQELDRLRARRGSRIQNQTQSQDRTPPPPPAPDPAPEPTPDPPAPPPEPDPASPQPPQPEQQQEHSESGEPSTGTPPAGEPTATIPFGSASRQSGGFAQAPPTDESNDE